MQNIKTISKIFVINLIVLIIIFLGLEIGARIIYPEFHGHLHSPSLTMGKKKDFSFFYGFPTRVINQENSDDEDLPYVLVFGDSISEGYGHAFEDIWWNKLKRLLRIKNENYNFKAIAGFGNNFSDNINNTNEILIKTNDLNIAKIIYQFNFNDLTPQSRSSLNKKNKSKTKISFARKFAIWRYEHLNKSVFFRVIQYYAGVITKKTKGTCEERKLHALGPYTWTFGSRPYSEASSKAWLRFSDNIEKIKFELDKRDIEFEIVIAPILMQIDKSGQHLYYNNRNYDFSCATLDPISNLKKIAERLNIKIYDPTKYIKRHFDLRVKEGNFEPFFFTADENHITPITSMYLAEYIAKKW